MNDDIFIPSMLYGQGFLAMLAWLAFLWLLGRSSGWSTLAARYAMNGQDPDTADWTGWQMGRIGCLYCLWVGVSDAGLLLKTGPDILFRAGHPPLFLPWQSIVGVKVQHAWKRDQLELQLADSPVRIRLPEACLLAARRYLPEAKPLSPAAA